MSDFTVIVDSDGQDWAWSVHLGDGGVSGVSRRITDVEDDARRAIVQTGTVLKYCGFTTDLRMARPYDFSKYDSADGFLGDASHPQRVPRRVLCDIDGTLALRNNRGPFEFDKVETDDLNDSVDLVLRSLWDTGLGIILLSGRSEEYRPHTERWLEKWLVPYDQLLMRPAGDLRSDDIVKLELFDKHVRDAWWPWLVLDDRDRCVYLWRKLGLSCFQVADGDF